MNTTWSSKNFENLKEKGFDIESCFLDLQQISIECYDLARYKKAFRVKIRTLIKKDEILKLQLCIKQLYAFAQFVKYIYGYHSCAVPVSKWQATLAKKLQKKTLPVFEVYCKDSWISYETTARYESHFKLQHKKLIGLDAPLEYVQDQKPFLTLKDKAHFEKFYLKF